MLLPRDLILLAVLIQLATAIGFYFIIKGPALRRLPLYLIAFAVISLAPLLVPGPRRIVRWLDTVLAITLMVKMYDVVHESLRGRRPGFFKFLTNLINGLWVVRGHKPIESKLTPRANLVLFLVRAPLFVAAFFAATPVWHVDWQRYPFLLEHLCKALVFYALFIFGANAVAAAWRFAGLTGMDALH